MDPNIPIATIMTTNLITVKIDDPLKKVKEIFENNNFHHIPVLKDGEVLAGIISKEDWLKRLKYISHQTTGRTWTDIMYTKLMAEDIMTAYPMVLDPDDTIGLAADIFLANKFHALPVVEDGQLLGMITSHDLLRFAFTQIIAD